MQDAVLERVRQTVSDVFNVAVEDVDGDSSPQTIEAWDSMGHLNLVLALEQAFSVSFDPEEIGRLVSVRSAAEAVAAKGGASS